MQIICNILFLPLIAYLEDEKLQIVGLIRSPEYRMIRRLSPELHLPQSLMDCVSSLLYGLFK